MVVLLLSLMVCCLRLIFGLMFCLGWVLIVCWRVWCRC